MISLAEVMQMPEKQEEIVRNIENDAALSRAHASHMHLNKHGGIDIYSAPFLPVTDERYEIPSKDLVSSVVGLLESRGYTKTDISLNLGITTNKNRTLLYWITESRATEIPYCAWRMLCVLAGLSSQTMLVDDESKERILAAAK